MQMFDSAVNMKDLQVADGIDSAINFDIPLITESTSSTPAVMNSQEAQPSRLVCTQTQQSETNDFEAMQPKNETPRVENPAETFTVTVQPPQVEQYTHN